MRTLLLAPTLLAACLVSPQPRALKYGELIEPGAVWSRALVDVAAPLDTVVLVVGAQSTDEAVLAGYSSANNCLLYVRMSYKSQARMAHVVLVV